MLYAKAKVGLITKVSPQSGEGAQSGKADFVLSQTFENG